MLYEMLVLVTGLEKVNGFLNIPKPMTQANFDTISNVLGSKETAEGNCRA